MPFPKRLQPRKALYLLPPFLLLLPISNLHVPKPPQDHCAIIAANPSHPPPHPLPHPHSRTLCLVHSLCLNLSSPHSHHLTFTPPSPPRCSLLSASFRPHTAFPLAPAFSCPDLRRERVLCAHGTGLRNHTPSCPAEQLVQGDLSWVYPRSLAIVVPDYPFPANIYHYGNVVTHVAAVVRHVDAVVGEDVPSVAVLFKGKENVNGWQRGFLGAVFTALRRQRSITWRFLDGVGESGGVVCMDRAVMLGFRGNVNVWPFVNDSDVVGDGVAVMEDAVWVKDAVYRAAGRPLVAVEGGHGFRKPPLVLGYAKRMGVADVNTSADLAASVRPDGMKRAFTEDDEEWFEGMLKEVTSGAGVEFRVFVTKDSDRFEHQVEVLEGVGVVVGIHGANLVNSWFVRPFGGLVEVLPHGVRSQCYVAGSNGGLKYWRFEASQAQERNESGEDGTGCDRANLECRLKVRQSGVVLSEKDREGLRGVVGEAVKYLRGLHEACGDTIPVTFDPEKAMYTRQ